MWTCSQIAERKRIIQKRQNLIKSLDMGKKQTSQIRELAIAMRTCSRMAERERIIQIPNILLSVKDVSVAISVSTKMVRLLIASGRLKAVNLSKRMTNTKVPAGVVKIKYAYR